MGVFYATLCPADLRSDFEKEGGKNQFTSPWPSTLLLDWTNEIAPCVVSINRTTYTIHFFIVIDSFFYFQRDELCYRESLRAVITFLMVVSYETSACAVLSNTEEVGSLYMPIFWEPGICRSENRWCNFFLMWKCILGCFNLVSSVVSCSDFVYESGSKAWPHCTQIIIIICFLEKSEYFSNLGGFVYRKIKYVI